MRKILVEVPKNCAFCIYLDLDSYWCKLFYTSIYPDDEDKILEPCYECKQSEVKDEKEL
mgnify:CR=1 FL=1